MSHPNAKLLWFTGAGFLFLWVDLALGHIGGGMKHPVMWLPVLYLPWVVLITLVTARTSTPFTQRVFMLTCRGAVVMGMLGAVFHGIEIFGEMHGSIQWEVLTRLLRYPPLLAPLAVSGLGMLGLWVNVHEPMKGGRE